MSNEPNVENVLILGSGAAGYTAAIYTARAKLEPLVIEGLQPGGQLTTTTEVENFPGFPEGIDGNELMAKMKAQAERFGARFIMASATASDLRARPIGVTLDSGDVLRTRALIIATGATARYLGLPSEKKLIGRGVSGCATCDGAFFRDVPVAVIGGGDTAAEDALFLTRFASKVYLVHRRDALRASKIMAERVLNHPKIEPLWNKVVDEVFDVEKNEVTGLALKDTQSGDRSTVEVAGMFVAIGHKPNTEAFAGQLETNDQGYLVARNTRTAIDGVYAAGDVQDPTYRQAISAAGSGCMAALEAQRYLEALEHA